MNQTNIKAERIFLGSDIRRPYTISRYKYLSLVARTWRSRHKVRSNLPRGGTRGMENDVDSFRTYSDLCLTMTFDIDISVWNDWYQLRVTFRLIFLICSIFHFDGNLVSWFTLEQTVWALITEPSIRILSLDETTYHVHPFSTCTIGYEFDIENFIPSNRKRWIVDFVELSSFCLQRVATRLWACFLVRA